MAGLLNHFHAEEDEEAAEAGVVDVEDDDGDNDEDDTGVGAVTVNVVPLGGTEVVPLSLAEREDTGAEDPVGAFGVTLSPSCWAFSLSV